MLVSLAQKGTKAVDIISPAFAVDCLETLEEINREFQELFLEAGGERFNYIPALNDSEKQLDLYSALIAENS